MIGREKYLDKLKSKFDKVEWENKEAIKKEYFAFIESGITPAIKIIEETSKTITLGMSKIAGTPDLPTNTEWPKFKDEPMVFLAQLNLSEIAHYTVEDHLPKSGILYFFAYYDKPVNKFGANFNFIQPKERYKVLFFNDDNTQLENTSFPEIMYPDYKFKQISINFEFFFQIPNDIYYYSEFDENLSYHDNECIVKFHNSLLNDLEKTQMLGVPLPLQGSVADSWALAYITKGEPDGDFEEEEEEEEVEDFDYEDEEELAEEFINLFSTPIFSTIGDAVGYFGIRKKDLMNANFDESIFVMQGT